MSEIPEAPIVPPTRPSFRAHLRRRLALALPLVAILVLSIAAFGQNNTVFTTTGSASTGRHQKITFSQPSTADTSSDVLGASTEVAPGNTSQTSVTSTTTVNTSQTSTSTTTTGTSTTSDNTSTDSTPTNPTPTPTPPTCYYCPYTTNSVGTACPNYCVYPTPTPPTGCGVCGGTNRTDIMCPMYCLD